MKKLNRLSISALLVLSLSFACILFGNAVFENSQEASAYVTRDEAELCLELNTYIEGPLKDMVDFEGFYECLIIFDEE